MITTGTILMGKDTLRPRCFHLEATRLRIPGYRSSTISSHSTNSKGNSPPQYGHCSLADEVGTASVGFDRAKMIRAALKRLITSVKAQKCNCIEINDVKTHSFIGVPYVRISARPRHIQVEAPEWNA